LPLCIFQTTPLNEIQALFETVNPVPNAVPNYNGAPGQYLPVVRLDPSTGSRSLDLIRWGIPFPWPSNDPTTLRVAVMAETVATTPAYRDAFEHRRCLILADGFFAWQERPGGTRQPYAIRNADGTPFALAGLWDEWRGSATTGAVHTCTVITVPSNEMIAPINRRMPAILPREEWSEWLGEKKGPIDRLLSMPSSYPAERMEAYRVSEKVGDARNNDASLIEPLA
jgi:putative SOS response-associated peptidase YedK